METSRTFSLNPLGQIVWEDRYGLKDENGNLIEKDILDTFRRVAKAIASKEADPVYWEEKFFEIMADGYFCPAGRILAHSGTHYSQLLNCFVLPFENDSLEEIMQTTRNMAIVQKYAGGTGFNPSNLRPSGSYIKGVNGRSCGVLGFLHMMSTTSEVIEQGGSRRGASIAVLEAWHPDVWEYISYKQEHNWDALESFIEVKDQAKWTAYKFNNQYKWQMFNVSVGVDDDFFKALKNDEDWIFTWKDVEWKLYTVSFTKKIPSGSISTDFDVTADCEKTALWKVRRQVPYPTPSDKFEIKSIRRVKASEVWDRICYNAWADGCPGLLNMSTIRKMHNLEYVNKFLSVNPCGEQALGKYGSCNLSSIVLPNFVDSSTKQFNFEKLKDVVRVAVRFADNVIDNCDFPLPEIRETALGERRVGLGTMGVHDMLIGLEKEYDSEDGRMFVGSVLECMRDTAYDTSAELAKERGPFPLFSEKIFESGFIKTLPNGIREKIATNKLRNGTLITQAPTGTIGTMHNVSTGCEPWFSLKLQRNTRLGSYEDGCPAFIKWEKEHKKEKIPSYFKTSQEISPENHIKMLITFTKYIDTSTSKTVNLPNSSTVEDVKKAFLFAMENGVKGVTVFRDGCKQGVLIRKDEKKAPESPIDEHEEDSVKNAIDHPDSRLEPKKRGNRAVGSTYRIHLQSHNLYVTVNRNLSGELVEVFTTVGESKNPNTHHTSGVEDSWAEGLGKIVSLALRAGVKPDSIIRNLKNIPSDKPVFTTIGELESSELIPSPPHAIARAMEEELRYGLPEHKKADFNKLGGTCPSCGSTNLKWKSPSCADCLDCGASGCG
jgi:ribonucleoside-diphosphate reductase alpha chain